MPETDIAVTKERVANHEERLKNIEKSQSETKELLIRMDQRQEELFHITKDMHDNGGTPRCYERAEKLKTIDSRLDKLEDKCEQCNIKTLTGDYESLKRILKWVLGVATPIMIFILSRTIYGLF